MTAIQLNQPLAGREFQSQGPFHKSFSNRKNDLTRWTASPLLRCFPEVHPGTKGHPNQPGLWPVRWISAVGPTREPVVAAYRLEFSLPQALKVRLHITADERYEFFVDGQAVGMGPERGDEKNWFFESYDVSLQPGDHTFVARVFSLGEKAPFAQISLGHGFLLCPDEASLIPLLGTGLGTWRGKTLPGYRWSPPASCAWGTGWNQTMDGGQYAWDHESGESEGWELPEIGSYGDSAHGVRSVSLQKGSAPHHRLRPAVLPAMLDKIRPIGKVRHVSGFSTRPVGLVPIARADHLAGEAVQWQRLVDGKDELTIPPHTSRRVILDLGDYFCGRPLLTTSGGRGGSIEIDWTEACYEHIDIPEGCDCIEGHVWPKGNRDDIEGKFFVCPWFRQDGPGDIFILDGGEQRTFSTLWWQAGRYLQVSVETGDEPLYIENISIRETRYPLEMEGYWQCSDPSLDILIAPMLRSMQTCSHETYMDCPFYEQLMYAGDTRLEMLVTYTLTKDDRLPRKALKLFDWSRLLSGLTQSRYPARVRQIIPPFSLWWVAMCHDYALWRGDAEFVKSLLPGIRAVCDHFATLINDDGLLTAPDGWNFTDWVPGWIGGVPPDGAEGISGTLNWQAALVFRMAGELEAWFGEDEISDLQRRRSNTIGKAAHKAFWNEERGLYADDLGHQHWSEHTQCLAILSEKVPAACLDRVGQSLIASKGLAATSIYFSHYLFEAYHKLNRVDQLFEKLDLWHTLKRDGLKTTIESPEPTRSDCHAWGAHPLYHYYATIAGIRPAAPGFNEVTIQPQLGTLTELDAILPHPLGEIRVQVRNSHTTIELPDGVTLAVEES